MHSLILPAIIGNGGAIYAPDRMTYTSSGAGFYGEDNLTFTDNEVTVTLGINRKPFTGNTEDRVFTLLGPSLATFRVLMRVYSSDHSTTELRNKVRITGQNSATGTIYDLLSDVELCDGEDHHIFFSYNGVLGNSAIFYVDGVDADDLTFSSRVLTTGSFETGANGYVGVGAYNNHLGGSLKLEGALWHVGVAFTRLTNPTDFYDPVRGLQEIDEDTWTEWGSQPLYWNKYGLMSENKGSAPNMDRHFTIEGPSLEYQPDMMQYDGVGGSYHLTGQTHTGNKVTVVGRFTIDELTRDSVSNLATFNSTNSLARIMVADSDYTADTDIQGKLQVRSISALGTTLCRLVSKNRVDDGEPHTFFYSFDGDLGLSQFYIDGVEADDTTGYANRVAPITGTFDSTSAYTYVGKATLGGNFPWPGEIGYLGMHERYQTNPLDFYDPDDGLQRVDEINWMQWGTPAEGGSQPLWWNAGGDMSDNKGTKSNMVKNAGVTGPSGGIEPYDPGMMTSDGSTGYYSDQVTTPPGSASTIVARFNQDEFTDESLKWVSRVYGSIGWPRLQIGLLASNHATLPNKLIVTSYDATGALLARVTSIEPVCTGTDHVVFVSYDPGTGDLTFYIDGEDADDPDYADRVLTTGTIDGGTGNITVAGGASAGKLSGSVGFYGYTPSYMSNPEDFMDGSYPMIIDETDWTEWSSQPHFWNQYGLMTDNKGSGGNMTANGTLTGPA